MAQGVAFDREQVLEALKPYFLLGYGIPKACQLAGFNDENIYYWIEQEPELLVKIKAWQGSVDARAREVIVKKITGEKDSSGKVVVEPDVDTAKWWAERRERDEFSTRSEQLNTSVTLDELLKEFDDPSNVDDETTDETD